MTYLDQARAEDFRHELQTPWGNGGWQFHDKCQLCGSPESLGTCPVSIDRFVLKALIAEIEALAKEHCPGCRKGYVLAIGPYYTQHRIEEKPYPRYIECEAKPEQRRLAQLREELVQMQKGTEKSMSGNPR